MPPPPLLPASASKTIRSKTFLEQMGQAFVLVDRIGLRSAFAKKFLRWTAREYSTENAIFLLVAEDFRTQATLGNLMQIRDDFITEGAKRQINLPSATRTRLLAKIDALNATASRDPDRRIVPLVFRIDVAILDECVADIRMLVNGDTRKRLLAHQFDTAFDLDAQQKREFDSAIDFLKIEYQISLI